MRILGNLINKSWDTKVIIFEHEYFTIYSKKEKGMIWIFVKKHEIERYFEKLIKTL